MSQDVSTNDLMRVIEEGFAKVNERFEQVDKSIAELSERQERGVIDLLNTISEAINTLSDSTDAQFRQMEAKMVTKEDLDDKLFGRKFYLRTV
jgi:uncharacterized protein YfbU (UPF0304 family)